MGAATLRGAALVVLIVAMVVTVALVGTATDMRGLLAGLAFWPLAPYLLLLVLTVPSRSPAGPVATLVASLVVSMFGLCAYYAGLVHAAAPPGPLVVALVPLGQVGLAAMVLWSGAVVRARRAGRRK